MMKKWRKKLKMEVKSSLKKSQKMRVLTCCLSMCAALPLLVEIAELRLNASANYGCILMFRFLS